MKFRSSRQPAPKYSSTAARHRRGATLVEVAIATMMLSVLLVPAIKLVGQSRDLQRRIADENELIFHAENLIDQFRIEVKDPIEFGRRYRNGYARTYTLESLQMPNVRGRIETEADTSVAGELITITTVAWNDENRNATRDGSEPFIFLRTQVAAP